MAIDDNILALKQVPSIYPDPDSTGTPPPEVYTDTVTADPTVDTTEGFNPHENPRNTLKV